MMFETNFEVIRAYFAAHAPEVPRDFEWRTWNNPNDQGTVSESEISRMLRWRWHYADAMIYEGTKNGSLE